VLKKRSCQEEPCDDTMMHGCNIDPAYLQAMDQHFVELMNQTLASMQQNIA